MQLTTKLKRSAQFDTHVLTGVSAIVTSIRSSRSALEIRLFVMRTSSSGLGGGWFGVVPYKKPFLPLRGVLLVPDAHLLHTRGPKVGAA